MTKGRTSCVKKDFFSRLELRNLFTTIALYCCHLRLNPVFNSKGKKIHFDYLKTFPSLTTKTRYKRESSSPCFSSKSLFIQDGGQRSRQMRRTLQRKHSLVAFYDKKINVYRWFFVTFCFSFTIPTYNDIYLRKSWSIVVASVTLLWNFKIRAVRPRCVLSAPFSPRFSEPSRSLNRRKRIFNKMYA